ncbi:MAG: hypothetical protein GX221_10785 [Candidatus Riflebacteria bacterium]|nr:hypothetical protein [Candidatus Riflebacteria bacterium]
MWIFKKIFYLMFLPLVAVIGMMTFAFPEEMREFKKDLVDLPAKKTLMKLGLVVFIFATVHLINIFDSKETFVRLPFRCSKD